MQKIKDYIAANDNMRIQAAKETSLDPRECLYETLFERMLYDIPTEYHEL